MHVSLVIGIGNVGDLADGMTPRPGRRAAVVWVEGVRRIDDGAWFAYEVATFHRSRSVGKTFSTKESCDPEQALETAKNELFSSLNGSHSVV